MLRENGFYTLGFSQFWIDRVQETGMEPLIISGLGFDPRSMQSAIILQKKGIRPSLLPIDFAVSTDRLDKNIKQAIDNNTVVLETIRTIHDPIKIDMFDDYNSSIGGRQLVNKVYTLFDKISEYKDIIVDIGGLPRVLFAPLLSFLIENQTLSKIGNIHVASLPDEILDKGIKSDQILEPSFIYGFNKPLSEDKFVWIPIIGKSDSTRLRNIYNRIEKNCIEICPILPLHPENTRITDRLLFDLRNVLFSEISTLNNNIMYVDRRSPFFIYREILKLSEYYTKLLSEFGEIKVLITPIDDKTSSVGAIMAAVEKQLPIMYADTISYKVTDGNLLLEKVHSEPMEIWLAGEAYET